MRLIGPYTFSATPFVVFGWLVVVSTRIMPPSTGPLEITCSTLDSTAASSLAEMKMMMWPRTARSITEVQRLPTTGRF
ncbi:hypothetical protein F4777DRAFT_536097 [Nemania sp. FL0916]|nr:hypothetical protein F4777DRAFT_536097 [Nemania sp. FL0916]